MDKGSSRCILRHLGVWSRGYQFQFHCSVILRIYWAPRKDSRDQHGVSQFIHPSLYEFNKQGYNCDTSLSPNHVSNFERPQRKYIYESVSIQRENCVHRQARFQTEAGAWMKERYAFAKIIMFIRWNKSPIKRPELRSQGFLVAVVMPSAYQLLRS